MHETAHAHHQQNAASSATYSVLTMTPDAVLDVIEALCLQEERGYQKCDYLAEVKFRVPLHHQASLMDETCRSCMVQWTNTLADFCQYNRETADIAISCLDRFLCTPEGSLTLLSSEQYQLAAMTAFYTSAKIHERQAIEPASIARLSRGTHTKESIEQMELYLLRVLQWRVHPPTAMRFAMCFLDLIPFEIIDEQHRIPIMDRVRYQLNVALSEYRLSLQRSSHLGLAVLMNAFDDQRLLDEATLYQIQTRIGSLLPSYHQDTIWDIQMALSVAVSSHPDIPAPITKEITTGVVPLLTDGRNIQLQYQNDDDKTRMLADGRGSPTGVFLNTV